MSDVWASMDEQPHASAIQLSILPSKEQLTLTGLTNIYLAFTERAQLYIQGNAPCHLLHINPLGATCFLIK
jgi:hypothetical protein